MAAALGENFDSHHSEHISLGNSIHEFNEHNMLQRSAIAFPKYKARAQSLFCKMYCAFKL
jgi:hypothetical protein